MLLQPLGNQEPQIRIKMQKNDEPGFHLRLFFKVIRREKEMKTILSAGLIIVTVLVIPEVPLLPKHLFTRMVIGGLIPMAGSAASSKRSTSLKCHPLP